MAQIKELIQGNVGRISELRKVGENNHVITVSIAATPRVKKVQNGQMGKLFGLMLLYGETQQKTFLTATLNLVHQY